MMAVPPTLVNAWTDNATPPRMTTITARINSVTASRFAADAWYDGSRRTTVALIDPSAKTDWSVLPVILMSGK